MFVNKKELFAARLNDLIKEKEVNLSIIERATGVPHNTLSRYAKCQNSPQIEQLWILSEYFGCTVDYLLGKTDY